MASSSRSGQVITFYSYKGGTGRSMALANAACVLAQRQSPGKGILMIDWDLEAPGLHRYFRAQFKNRFGHANDQALDEYPGLIDFFWELDAKLQQQNGTRKRLLEEDAAVTLLEEIDLRRFILETDIPCLSLIKAGRFGEEYSSRVNTFRWEAFYHHAPLLLRVFAESLAEQYSYVLVDSRTGLTDTSGICTMLLPEKLVVVFTPNRQSLTGILGLVQRATNYRRQSDDLRPLVVFPLASRIEPTENTLRQYWRKGRPDENFIGYQSQFEQIFREVYGLPACHLDTYFNHALIQHVPPYAYGENIAVLAEPRGESLILAQRYETFAQLLVSARAPWDEAETAFPADDSPYRALQPFHEVHEELFFGRQEVVEQLRQRLVEREQRFLVIDGPSGSGKTSLIQAGMLPRIRNERPGWGAIVVQLDADPFAALQLQGLTGAAQSLVEAVRQWLLHQWMETPPTQDRLLLIFDQFETMFLTCPTPVRERFLSQLEQTLSAALPLSVVVVIRNDFLPFLSQYVPPSLLETWWKTDNVFSLPTTLERDDLNDIVREPAAAVGLAFQDGLIETIVDNAIELAPTGGERGRAAQSMVLPLLEHALDHLWQKRQEGFLSHDTYHAIGELTGYLPDLTERTFSQLSTEEQALARHILLQLIQIGDATLGMSDTRQRRLLADLCANAELREATHRVVAKLASARLVVTTLEQGKATVEIIHDALLQWPEFKKWLARDRNFLLWKQRLQFALAEWQRTASDKGGLLRGALLDEAERWLNERPSDLSVEERPFVQESLALRRAEEGEKEAQQRRELEAAQALVRLEAAQALAREANARRDAEAQARQEAETRANEQATTARRLRRQGFWLLGALVLAVLAVISMLVALRQVRKAEQKSNRTMAKQLVFSAEITSTQSPALLDLSTLLAVESIRHFRSPEAKRLLRPVTALLRLELTRVTHENWVNSVAFSPDGQQLATASRDKTARLWEVSSGKELARVTHADAVTQVAFSPDGKVLATASEDKTARLWEVSSGKELARLPHEGAVYQVAFSPDGRRLATGSSDKTARLWEVSSGKERVAQVRKLFSLPHEGAVYGVAFSSDGQRLATGSSDKTARLWEVSSGIELALLPHEDAVYQVAFSPDGQQLATGSSDKTARLWEVRSGIELARLPHEDAVYQVAFSPDGQQLATASRDKTARLWEVSSGKELARLPHEDAVYGVAFSPDGQQLATASRDKTVRLWEVSSGKEFAHLTSSEDMIKAACARLNRNLTQEEWKQYLVDEPYRRTCKDLPIHSSVLEEGRNLAKAGKRQDAIVLFRKMKKLDPNLTLDPETETRQYVALGLIEKGKRLASDGNLPEAIAAFRGAKSSDPNLTLDPDSEAHELAALGMIEKGKKLAREGQVPEAIAAFREACSLDPSLPLDPDSEAHKLAAPGMIEKGKKLAREGQVPEAIAAFREARSLDPSLTLDPDSEARKLAVPGLVDKGKTLAKEGKVQEALDAYARAQQLGPTGKISAEDWNYLCWFGGIEGHAAAVMDVCQKAVALDPKNGNFRDSRGVARALTGDAKGAVADFKFFTKWTEKERQFEKRRPQREEWIAELQAGRNPLDVETLKALREE